jgi:hypothetical protein
MQDFRMQGIHGNLMSRTNLPDVRVHYRSTIRDAELDFVNGNHQLYMNGKMS